jgi:hypothetical protein
VRGSDVQGFVVTHCFEYWIFSENSFEGFPDLIVVCWFVKSYGIAATTFVFNTLVESIEERGNTQNQNHHRDKISNLSVFNELEVGMLEDVAAYFGEIFKMSLFVGIEISDQSGDQDAAEKGKKDTQDLCCGKAQNRTQTEIKQDTGSQ